MQAFWDPQVKVPNHTSVLQMYFNYKHSFIELKKIISLMVSVNTNLVYTNIPDVKSVVIMEQKSSGFSIIYVYIFLWERNHLWHIRVAHITLPKKWHIHNSLFFLFILIPRMSHQSKMLVVQYYLVSYFCMSC